MRVDFRRVISIRNGSGPFFIEDETSASDVMSIDVDIKHLSAIPFPRHKGHRHQVH